MKKYFYIAIATLTLTACGEKNKEKTDSTPEIQSRDMKGLKIAYYNLDSLVLHFDYYVEQDSIITKRRNGFQAEYERRGKELENFVRSNQEKQQKGLLSEREIAQIQQVIQQREMALMNYQQTEGGKLEKEIMDVQSSLNKKVKVFGEEFAKKHGIDILMIHAEVGSPINFIDPSMDVTKEFTAYLNEHQAEIEKDMGKK